MCPPIWVCGCFIDSIFQLKSITAIDYSDLIAIVNRKTGKKTGGGIHKFLLGQGLRRSKFYKKNECGLIERHREIFFCVVKADVLDHFAQQFNVTGQ